MEQTPFDPNRSANRPEIGLRTAIVNVIDKIIEPSQLVFHSMDMDQENRHRDEQAKLAESLHGDRDHRGDKLAVSEQDGIHERRSCPALEGNDKYQRGITPTQRATVTTEAIPFFAVCEMATIAQIARTVTAIAPGKSNATAFFRSSRGKSLIARRMLRIPSGMLNKKMACQPVSARKIHPALGQPHGRKYSPAPSNPSPAPGIRAGTGWQSFP